MPFDDFDKKMFEAFERLPREEVHPSTKVELMQRIERFNQDKRKENVFSTWFLRLSGAALVASVALFIGISPMMVKHGQNADRIQQARTEIKEEVYQTNEIKRYFDSVTPDYSYVQYVNY